MGNKENVSEIRKALFEKLIAPDYICDPDDVEDLSLIILERKESLYFLNQ